jgi:hypothetical protein
MAPTRPPRCTEALAAPLENSILPKANTSPVCTDLQRIRRPNCVRCEPGRQQRIWQPRARKVVLARAPGGLRDLRVLRQLRQLFGFDWPALQRVQVKRLGPAPVPSEARCRPAARQAAQGSPRAHRLERDSRSMKWVALLIASITALFGCKPPANDTAIAPSHEPGSRALAYLSGNQ